MPQRYLDTWSHGDEFVNIIDVVIPPDVMLPCQMPGRQQSSTPEGALLSDVYRDAMKRLERSYKRPSHRTLRARGEVLSWIYGDSARVSFEMVCANLGVEPEILRAGIVDWCREMERGKFRQVVVRPSPVQGDSNKISNLVARGESRARYDKRQRRARVQAAMEVG